MNFRPLHDRILIKRVEEKQTVKGGLEEQGSSQSERARALALAAQGKYRLLIDRILPLSRAAEAHRLVEANTVVGKVVIDPTLSD